MSKEFPAGTGSRGKTPGLRNLVRIGVYSGDLDDVKNDEYYDKNGLHIEEIDGWPASYLYDESEHQEIITDADQARAMVRQLQEML